MERTLVLIKPDGVKRGLIGKIINEYEERSLEILALKMLKPTKAMAEKHYSEHEGKEFFQELINYITEDNICAMILSGEKAIDIVRKINGNKDPIKSELGSIRGKYTLDKTHNLVHASDSVESAEREIKIWFAEFTEANKYDGISDLFARTETPKILV